MMIAVLKLILALVVALVISLILWAVLVYLWLRWKVRNLTEELSGKFAKEFEAIEVAMASENVPPLRVKLLRLEGGEWGNRERLEEWACEIIQNGFRLIGDFEVEPTLVQLRAFLHEESKTYAVIYEHPKIGLWFDFVSLKPAGTGSFTLSNGQDHQLDQRGTHPKILVPSPTVPTSAFKKFLEDRPDETWGEVSADDFVPRFEHACADEMD